MGGGMGGMDPAMLQQAMGMMQNPVSGRGGREGGRERERKDVAVFMCLSLMYFYYSSFSRHSHPSLPSSFPSLRPCVVKSCSNFVPPTQP